MFYGMMRVHSEERYIRRSVESLLKVCDLVFVMDDHSTDATAEMLWGINNCVLLASPFEGLEESRDKTWLLGQITLGMLPDSFGPDSSHWVICIDGDEELCVPSIPSIPSTIHYPVSYSFQILQLWDSPGVMRVDPPYNNLLRPSMFRLIKPGMVFKSSATHGGGFHCGNVPADIGFGVTVHEPVVRVKHYGYMEEADRMRKFKFYMEHDAGHEDWYRKECYGVGLETAKISEGL